MKFWLWLTLGFGLGGQRHRDALAVVLEENRILRARLRGMLGGKRLLLRDEERKRLAVLGARLGRKGLAALELTFSPETLLRWHRQLVALKYDGSSSYAKARPVTDAELVALVLRFSRENETWGYRRISGALANLGHKLSASTVRRILKDHGMAPAPRRKRELTWQAFIERHRDVISACDFFTVEVWSKLGLVRYHVLFLIHLACRRVEIAGIVPEPNGHWMEQKARHLIDDLDGFLLGKKYLLADRGTVFTKRFEEVLAQGGVQLKRLPPRSPNLNAYAERFVRSIKEECLSRVIILGEGHLERLVKDYVAHYHHERNHQGLNNRRVIETAMPRDGPIQCRQRQGGLLKYYFRSAA